MRLVAISDTHQQHSKIIVPDGDLLIHSGDATNQGSIGAFGDFANWMKQLPHTHKIFVGGNHDGCLENANRHIAEQMIKDAGVIYLHDQSVVIEGYKIYGSPYQPFFGNWAFNLHRGKQLQDKWAQIPDDTEILITHGPPFGIGDEVLELGNIIHVGDQDLLNRMYQLPNLKIKVHGHLHLGYSIKIIANIAFINASCCTEQYKPINQPIVYDL